MNGITTAFFSFILMIMHYRNGCACFGTPIWYTAGWYGYKCEICSCGYKVMHGKDRFSQ